MSSFEVSIACKVKISRDAQNVGTKFDFCATKKDFERDAKLPALDAQSV